MDDNDEHATSNVPEEWQGLPDYLLDEMMSDEQIRHMGDCYPDCGCPESDAFDWDDFADAINNSDPT